MNFRTTINMIVLDEYIYMHIYTFPSLTVSTITTGIKLSTLIHFTFNLGYSIPLSICSSVFYLFPWKINKNVWLSNLSPQDGSNKLHQNASVIWYYFWY